VSEITTNDVAYDLEVYPNCFLFAVESLGSGKSRIFEISHRKNELGVIKAFIERLVPKGIRMVGYNNYGYDYPVLHYLLNDLKNEKDAGLINRKLYEKSKSIIEAPHHARFAHVIWDRDHIVPQIDLFKIHHFDNVSKATSLKILEYNMRMDDIRDLPFPPGTVLTSVQIDVLIGYNKHDVRATVEFFKHTVPMIRFRESMSAKYDRNFMNHNDTKIGKDYFVMELERHLGKQACFTKVDGRRKPNQTLRETIAINDVIFDYVEFKTPAFRAVEKWLRDQIITETKGVFSDLTLEQMLPFIDHSPLGQVPKVDKWLDDIAETGLIDGAKILSPPKTRKDQRRLSVMQDGVEWVFGTGGIHASINNTRVEATPERMIMDVDVTSMYPSIAIANRVYPEHLTDRFVDIYQDMKDQRVKYAKGSPENAMLKLALNGVFGDSNNKFSPFYDPQYTIAITVNGQLLLCMLWEKLRQVHGLEVIQANTDGITFTMDRDKYNTVKILMSHWEKLTGMDLEEAEYEFMHIRDCNNYVAKFVGSDKVKRKGTYAYVRPDEANSELGWHQNHSALVVQKAACANIIDGADIRDFIETHTNDFDFMLRTKVPRSSRLVADWGLGLTEVYQNVTRYYIAVDGPELSKMMPPLPTKPGHWRKMAINKGYRVKEENHFTGVDESLINYNWYVEQAEKLVDFGEVEL
jgi:hypothetical protein